MSKPYLNSRLGDHPTAAVAGITQMMISEFAWSVAENDSGAYIELMNALMPRIDNAIELAFDEGVRHATGKIQWEIYEVQREAYPGFTLTQFAQDHRTDDDDE